MGKTRYSVEELQGMILKQYMIRQPKPHKIEEYAELMEDGSMPPPVVVGFNKHKKTDPPILVDGHTRVAAAERAGVKELEAVERHYEDLASILADALVLNQGGEPIPVPDRNRRIIQLREQFKWSQERIAKDIHMHQATVSRILGGKQGTVRGGVTPAADGERKRFKAMSAKAILATADKIERSMHAAQTKADLAAACWFNEGDPELSKKDLRQAASNLDTLKGLQESLSTFFEALEKELKAEKKK